MLGYHSNEALGTALPPIPYLATLRHLLRVPWRRLPGSKTHKYFCYCQRRNNMWSSSSKMNRFLKCQIPLKESPKTTNQSTSMVSADNLPLSTQLTSEGAHQHPLSFSPHSIMTMHRDFLIFMAQAEETSSAHWMLSAFRMKARISHYSLLYHQSLFLYF